MSGSNFHYKKRRADSVKEENKKLATNILLKKNDVKDYKKKMDNEIKEYLELRNHIRKMKPSEIIKGDKKLRHSKSEAKNLQRVTLESIEKNEDKASKDEV